MPIINLGHYGHTPLDKIYENMRTMDPCMYRTWSCFKSETRLAIKYYNELEELIVWINKNISSRIDLNNDATDSVLLRIACGMLNKINIPKDNKIKLHLALLREWRTAKLEWKNFCLQKQIKELPF